MRKTLNSIVVGISLSMAACSGFNPQPPSWTNQMFSQQGHLLNFTGISDRHTSEVESVNRAINFAEQGFARFCGVDLDSFVEHQGSSHAEMGVNIDTSTSSSNVTLKSQARIKQSVISKRFTKEDGNFFKSWIVLTVPATQYEECQAYKKKLAEKEERDLENKNSILTSENTELNEDNERLLNYQDLQLRVGQLEEQNNDLREEIRITQQNSFVDKTKSQDLEKQLTSLKIEHNKLIATHAITVERRNDQDFGLLVCTNNLKQSQNLEKACVGKLVAIRDSLKQRVENQDTCNKILNVFNN